MKYSLHDKYQLKKIPFCFDILILLIYYIYMIECETL